MLDTTAATAEAPINNVTTHITEVASKGKLGPEILQQILAKYKAAPPAQVGDTPYRCWL